MTNSLGEISGVLKLRYDFQQDWGICNVDATRVSEFVRFYRSRDWPVGLHIELADLILGSAFEAIQEGQVLELADEDLSHFLRCCWKIWPDSLEYWRSYALHPEWRPGFAFWLSSAMTAAGQSLVGGELGRFWRASHAWQRVLQHSANWNRAVATDCLLDASQELWEAALELPTWHDLVSDWPLDLSGPRWSSIYELGQSIFDGRFDLERLTAGEELPDQFMYLNLADALADIDAELSAGIHVLARGAEPSLVYGTWKHGFDMHWRAHIEDLQAGIKWRNAESRAAGDF